MTKPELVKKHDIIWGNHEEKAFQNQKDNAKHLLKHLTSSSSCNDIGLSSFIQQLLHRNRTGEMRVFCFNSGSSHE